MHNIALPNKISFKEGEDANTGQVIIEPCFPGYGITIGNSLRRVLLSSLEGAAVVGVKIEGVDHEFMSLPNVKEDILEILMNLKQLKIKVFSDEVVELKLKAAGKKAVKASDIEDDSNVEIVNKDLVLANLSDMAGNLNMTIFAKKGIGYETIEAREEKTSEIGYIELDSIFSPVMNAAVNIENVRVGKMTNWDKLVIDISTDGTLSPFDAFKKANQILIEQFKSLTEKDSKQKEDSQTDQAEAEKEEDEDSEQEKEKTKKKSKSKKKDE